MKFRFILVNLFFGQFATCFGFTSGFLVSCDLHCGPNGKCEFIRNWFRWEKQCVCNNGFDGHHCEHDLHVAQHSPEFTTHTLASATTPTSTPTTTYTTTPITTFTTRPTLTSAESKITSTTPSATQSTPVVISANPTTLVTSTLPEFKRICSKFTAVYDVAEKIVESNDIAWRCESGNHSSPEAFVLNNCGLNIPTQWKQGPNVLEYCGQIPTYTPIASFENGKYSSSEGLTGIVVGCLDNAWGFKIMIQRCDQTPTIETFNKGEKSSANPSNFYTIEL